MAGLKYHGSRCELCRNFEACVKEKGVAGNQAYCSMTHKYEFRRRDDEGVLQKPR